MKQKVSRPGKEKELRIRSLGPADRPRIEEMVISSGKFNDPEIATALELVDESLESGEEESGYIFAVLEDKKGNSIAIKGYACYGPTPLTQGVYDLYWIVVDPADQGKGFGRFLIEYVEKEVMKRGVACSSSRPHRRRPMDRRSGFMNEADMSWSPVSKIFIESAMTNWYSRRI